MFERSNFVSVFSVPDGAYADPTNELSSKENEVCYDTDNGPLSEHMIKRYDNPLKGQIEIDPMHLALSREGGKGFIGKAETSNTAYKAINKDVKITDALAKEYQEWYTKKEKLCTKLGSLPKKVFTKKGPQRAEESEHLSKSSSSSLPPVQTLGRSSTVTQPFASVSSSSPSEKPLFSSSSSSSSPKRSPLATRSSSSQLEQPEHSSSSSDAAAHAIRQNLEKSHSSVSMHDSLTPPSSPSHSVNTSERQQHTER